SSFIVLIRVEFFIYQSAIIDRVRDRNFPWGPILVHAIKFFIVTIPVLLLAWLLYYLLNKIAGRFPAPIAPAVIPGSGPAPPQPLHWPSFLFSALRLILFGVTLPLTSIRPWIFGSATAA